MGLAVVHLETPGDFSFPFWRSRISPSCNTSFALFNGEFPYSNILGWRQETPIKNI